MKPILDRSFLEDRVSKMHKKKYNQYQWWRRYQPRFTLDEKSPLHSRIANGDLEASHYLYQAEMELLSLQDKEKQLKEVDDIHEARRLFHERHKRLQEDFQKDESKLLEDVKKSFTKEFGIKREELERTMEDFEGSLMDMYNHFASKRTQKIKFSASAI
jgi:hypothetical protein